MFKRNDRFSLKHGLPKQKKVTPFFILRYQKSDIPKYAVVAGKKVSKKAVERNRVKRLFLDSLKETLQDSSNAYDLVFFLRLPSHEYLKSAIIDELEKTLSEINNTQT